MRERNPLFVLVAMALVACQPTGPGPAVPTLVPTLAPVGTGVVGEATSAAPAPTATQGPPRELVVCQEAEPATLYRYAEASSDRAGIFEALYDGPIDQTGFAFTPVILEDLPTLANGGLELRAVEVEPGDTVVDANTLQITSLAEGVNLALADGRTIVYSGDEPIEVLQLVATFRLRPGVLWSDGQQLTADDSFFSYQLAQYFDSPTSKFVTERTEAYEVVDARTVRWTGLAGWRDLDYQMRFFAPMPAHLYADINPSEVRNNTEANERPIGWGPFRLADWVRGDRLVLERNPNYFRAAEGLPRVDRVIFRFGLAPEQVLADLRAGLCDIGAENAGFASLLGELREAEAAGTLQPQFVAGTTYEHLDFGIRPAEGYRRAAGVDLFADVNVRRAIAHCLDREAMLEALQGGVGAVANTYVPETHPWYAGDELALYAFNAELGQQLLAEAGWADNTGDGVRERAGVRLALNLTTGPESSPFRQALVQLVSEQLRANCGVEVSPNWQTQEVLYASWPTGPLFGRQFDLGAFPWRAGHTPPCELYLTRAIPDELNPAGVNNLGYSNPAFDQACERALTNFDPEVERDSHIEAQVIFSQELPSLPLFFRVRIGVTRPEVEGYQLDGYSPSDLWNLEAIGVSP